MLRLMMALNVLALSMLAWCPEAQAQAAQDPLPDEATVLAAFDRGNRAEAARHIDRLVDARLRPGAVRPDPLLDRLVGEALVPGNPRLARIFLTRALAATGIPDRARYLLLLGEAHERLLDMRQAQAAYREALADGRAAASQRQAAAAGLTRALLVDRPAEALEIAERELGTQGGGDNWEIALIASRAARIMGRDDAAAAYLDSAARLAWSAPYRDNAIARVALDHAAIAGRAGDRQALVALTGLVRGSSYDQPSMVNTLPECGRNGIGPDDFIIIELRGAANERSRIGVIQASRPGIAAAFVEALAERSIVAIRTQPSSLMLRCTNVPRTPAAYALPGRDPISEWAAERGIYPIYGWSDPNHAAAATRLAERESLLGRESPHLVPALAALIMTSGAAFAGEATDARDRMLGYGERLGALLRTHQAPPDAQVFANLSNLFIRMAMERSSPAQGAAELQALIAAAAGNPALGRDALLLISEQMARMPPIGREFEAATLAQVLAATAGDDDDPRRRRLALRLLQLHRDMGNEPAAEEIRQAHGFAGDLCAVLASRPRYLTSDIRAEDYPEDSIAASLFGFVTLEFALDAEGRAQAPRIVIADPPFVFDAISLQKAPTIRYEPARSAGQSVACQGTVQTLRWQLPPIF